MRSPKLRRTEEKLRLSRMMKEWVMDRLFFLDLVFQFR